MNRIQTFLSFFRNNHDHIYKVFLFAVSVVFIVYFFPKEAPFKYDFQKNKPWFHEDLIAPYNIPIVKSQHEILAETKQLTAAKKLYFIYEDKPLTSTLIKFDTLFQKNYTEFITQQKKDAGFFGLFTSNKNRSFEELKESGHKTITHLYNKGIIEQVADTEGFSDSSQFFVYRNKYYAEYTLRDVFSPKTATEYILQQFEKSDNKSDELLQLTLENSFSNHPENIVFSEEQTSKSLSESLKSITNSGEQIIKGQGIIKRGDIVNDYLFKILNSFEEKHKRQALSSQKKYTITLGQTLLVSILITCFALYILFFRRSFLENNKNLVFLLLIIVSSVVFTSIVLSQNIFNIYMVPLCLIPLIIRSFFDSRTAFFVLLIVVLLLGLILPNGLHFVFIQLVAGMVGLYGFVNFSNRSQLFITSMVILLSYSLCYLALNIVIEGDFEKIDWFTFGWLAISAFLTLLAYPVIYIFEKIFGFVSDVTLLELADTNNKLLRELSRKAPGTFQHSLQVANLAEAAIFKIGGNSLLIRTAALYHDIGKMDAPMYFIENQSTGVNPHDELAYEESAQIIINHVIKGIEIAKKNKLPDLIIDFIRTHHGTTKTEYFFRKFKEENPEETNFEAFNYPGPIPFSKESAVLMISDSVEAASRSIKQPDVEKIDLVVEAVIGNQMAQDQFVNANITLRDITQIKKIFKKMLMNIYHVRVEYPH
ncbi:MAG: putative nucleotidyltransferase with HDIG domain [Saprospiraceae bacterium]|jgi:putative nucleotidyltransferase with HDIG domain